MFARERGRRRRPGPARPPPGRLAAPHSSGHPAVPYIPDSNKQNSVLMYYAAGILASSETAGGRPGRAWSAPSSSCLGPCSRSLSRANTPSPRLLHVSLTITLRRSVSIVRCLPNTLLTCQDDQAPTPLFSVGSKVIRRRGGAQGG